MDLGDIINSKLNSDIDARLTAKSVKSSLVMGIAAQYSTHLGSRIHGLAGKVPVTPILDLVERQIDMVYSRAFDAAVDAVPVQKGLTKSTVRRGLEENEDALFASMAKAGVFDDVLDTLVKATEISLGHGQPEVKPANEEVGRTGPTEVHTHNPGERHTPFDQKGKRK